MKLSLIAAVAENNVIGSEGNLPWPPIHEDFKRFKRLTLGRPVIMGRKTFKSIYDRLGKPLPERTNIVITSQRDFSRTGKIIVCHSISEALQIAQEQDDELAYVIGGGQIYKATISRADYLDITEIHHKYSGDTFFPDIDLKIWQETERDDRTGYSFITYERKR